MPAGDRGARGPQRVTDVLRQPDRLNAGGHRRHVRAVAHYDQLNAIAAQPSDALNGPLQLSRTVPHREDHAGELHRSLFDATIAVRCATTISAPTARHAISRTRVASRPPRR